MTPPCFPCPLPSTSLYFLYSLTLPLPPIPELLLENFEVLFKAPLNFVSPVGERNCSMRVNRLKCLFQEPLCTKEAKQRIREAPLSK